MVLKFLGKKTATPAVTFVVLMGIVSLFADMTHAGQGDGAELVFGIDPGLLHDCSAGRF